MSSSLQPARIEAPAKLTLSLRITGVRDDGYHLIDAEMVSLSVCDIVTIVPATSSTLAITGQDTTNIPTDASNLVMKALQHINMTANVAIEKHIPAGGGLGGGSTDAAAIFRWAQFDDLESAARIGADIAFCMVGGRARVEGIGEIVTPLPYEHRVITLVIPPIHVSTPDVYRMWDELGGPHHESGNDLEPAALAAEPDLAHWKELIASTCGETPRLAGSGATWWVPGHHRQLLQLHDATVVMCETRPDAGLITAITA